VDCAEILPETKENGMTEPTNKEMLKAIDEDIASDIREAVEGWYLHGQRTRWTKC